MNYYSKKPKISFGVKFIVAIMIIVTLFAIVIVSHFATVVIMREKYDLPATVYGITDTQ